MSSEGRAGLLLEWGLLAAAALATCAIAWAGDLWLSNDGPQHLFMAWAAMNIDDPALGYGRYFEAVVPSTSLGYRALFVAFEPWAGWRLAHRLTLVVTVELWAIAFFALVSTFSPRRRILGLLGFPTAFQLCFFLGFLPYCVGTALGMFALVAWHRIEKPLLRATVTSLLLYFTARAHIIAAAVAGLVLVILALSDDRDRLAVRLAVLAACGLPAVIVLIESRLGSLAATLTAEAGADATRWATALDERVLQVFQPGPLWRGLVLWGFMLAGYASSLRAKARDKALAAGCLGLACLSIALPMDIGGWQYAGPRLFPIVAMVLVALFAVERLPPRSMRAAKLVIVLYTAASLSWAAWFALGLRERSALVIAPLATLEERGPHPRFLAPAILDPCLGPCGEALALHEPGLHLGQLYAVVLGGEAAATQSSSRAIHGLIRREDVERIEPPSPAYWYQGGAARAEAHRRLAIWLSLQEAVLIVGDPPDLQLFRDAGYVAELDTGRVFLGSFEGCAGRIEVEGGAGRLAHVGAWPIRTPASSIVLDEAGKGAVTGIPCDEVWLFVEGMSCEGADEGQPMRGRWLPGADNSLSCARRPP
jgi:hypothetical protein